MKEPLWTPSPSRLSQATLSQFTAWVAARTGSSFADYEDLHRYSVNATAEFWSSLWDFSQVIGEKGEPPYLADAGHMPGARFFPNAQLNFAENLLGAGGADPAIVFWGEDKVKRRLSRDELSAEIARTQAALRQGGVTVLDRVAAILPNMPEGVVGVLATAALGAVWSSCSPDFGVEGVLDRFGQIEPKVLIACDGYHYNGKSIDISDKLAAITSRLPTLRLIVVVSYLGRAKEVVQRLNANLVHGQRAQTWADAVSARAGASVQFTRLPFAHPLYIMFSSGTTGMPKCIVHSAGGTLLKHLSEHRMHCDLRAGDRLFYFTTLGWMMWNWLISGLASGATLLLYDGSPFHPSGSILWDYAEAEKATHFGTSAKYIDALKKAGLEQGKTHDLSAMRALLSTGSPLAPESFDYIYASLKQDLHLASISGGTDICGCFVLGVPTKPVWRGEIQGPGLGMAVDVFDADGNPAKLHDKGELVCTKPFPSMPIGFWNDADGKKYRSAYFSRFDNIWHHGDFAEWTEHGGMIIQGRSDATLNPGGVRIGTAEIYRQVEQLEEVQESIVIGQDWEHDVRVVLFVILKPGLTLDAGLSERIKRQIRTGASPRHVPARVVQVADIPRTKSGKITELAVREVVHGREVKNKEALANPEALDLYRNLAELAD
jgi:acetoacetyl-CoA synthetase